MAPDLSRKFLAQLDTCDPNPQITQVPHTLCTLLTQFHLSTVFLYTFFYCVLTQDEEATSQLYDFKLQHYSLTDWAGQ